MFWQFLVYGLTLAIGALALNWIELNYLTRAYPGEVVILIIASSFLILGVWIGGKLTTKPTGADFVRNTAALDALGITRREYAVLEMLATGRSNKEIARHLNVSPNTIKTHLGNLFEKLQVNRRTQAVARARALELIA